MALLMSAGLPACTPPPSAEAIKAVAETCNPKGLVAQYSNTGTNVRVECVPLPKEVK